MIARVKVGVVFPQSELPTDAASVREFAKGAERLGFHHFLAYDHVVGADPSVHVGWRGPYDVDTTFHEPLVLFGFLAGITSMELATAIIISPQRQTVLLAKQAAEVDILSGGAFDWGLALVGTRSNTRRWDRRSSPEGCARRSRSSCFDVFGPSEPSPLTVTLTI